MSYNNYKAKIWDKAIDRELKRLCVFAADCNTKYSGVINGKGDTVRIQGVGKPTISVFGSDADISLSGAEKVADTSVSLVADHVATANYGVGDIDKAQGAGDVLSMLNTETSEGFANEIDKLVANLSLEKQAKKLTAVTITADNILGKIDEALQALYENDVDPTSVITVTLDPARYTLFRRAYTALDTNNSEMLKNGQVARYSNAIIRMSNNVAEDSSGKKLIQVKTQRALALAQSEVHTEPYRPEDNFMDCVKGFVIYGAKIVRPKEMVNIVCN